MTADHAPEGLTAKEREGLRQTAEQAYPPPSSIIYGNRRLLEVYVERVLASRTAALRAECDALRERVWREGWEQGTSDAWQNGGHESKPNPYRAVLHPDPSEESTDA